MLKLFFDDSGTHDGSSVMALGGFISHEEKWVVFEQEWAQALNDYGLDWFHMTDFENRRGRFESWPENKRIARLNRLLTIANRAAGASVGMSVDVRWRIASPLVRSAVQNEAHCAIIGSSPSFA